MYDLDTYRQVIREAMRSFATNGWASLDMNPYQDKHRANAWMHGLDMQNERKDMDDAMKSWRLKQTNKRQGSASRHGLSV